MCLSVSTSSSQPYVAIGTMIDQKIILHVRMVSPHLLIPRPEMAFKVHLALAIHSSRPDVGLSFRHFLIYLLHTQVFCFFWH